MSDLFFRKLMIKWNMLTIVYIEKHAQQQKYTKFKQTSSNIIGKIWIIVPKEQLLINRGGWVGLSETGVVGWGRGEYSLSCSLSIWIVIPAIEPISRSLEVEGEKGACVPGLKTSKYSVYIQLIIFPLEYNIVQIRHIIPACVHNLLNYIWEHLVPYLHSPFLFGSNWNSS